MLDAAFSVVQLFDGCRSRVRVPVQCACNRAGCVDRDGEGSTGPSRGEHRLTVYRAHASFHFLRNCQDDSWKLLCCIRVFLSALERAGMYLRTRKNESMQIRSEFGGAKPKVPPNGNPSPAPSTRTARIARTTRQINGARSFGV